MSLSTDSKAVSKKKADLMLAFFKSLGIDCEIKELQESVVIMFRMKHYFFHRVDINKIKFDNEFQQLIVKTMGIANELEELERSLLAKY